MTVPNDEAEAAARIIRDNWNVVWVIPSRMLRDIRDFCRADALDWSGVEDVIATELAIRRVPELMRINTGGPEHG